MKLFKDVFSTNFRESALVLRSIIESFQDVIIFALDNQYRYLAFNNNHFQTMKRIWDVEIAVGQCILDYIKNDYDRTKAKINFDRALAGESFITEEEYGDNEIARRYYENSYNPIVSKENSVAGLTLLLTDITERKALERDRELLIQELRESLREVKTLSGLLPICASCKKIRDDEGYWSRIEDYLRQHAGANFTHGFCPECYEQEMKKIKDWK